MKALVKVLRFDRNHRPTEVSILAILIAVLNLSSLKEIVRGIKNMKFMASLQDIVKAEGVPYVNKSIAMLAVSNIFTLAGKVQLSQETKEFAFYVLENWRKIEEEEKEHIEVVKNLVYASLILFYNLILKKP